MIFYSDIQYLIVNVKNDVSFGSLDFGSLITPRREARRPTGGLDLAPLVPKESNQ